MNLWWGPWEFNEGACVLVLHQYGYPEPLYDIDIEKCTTAAETLDRIIQVAKKRWATPEIVAHLVFALQELIDPQGTLCSFGTAMELKNPRAEAMANIAEISQVWEERELKVVNLAELKLTPADFRGRFR